MARPQTYSRSRTRLGALVVVAVLGVGVAVRACGGSDPPVDRSTTTTQVVPAGGVTTTVDEILR